MKKIFNHVARDIFSGALVLLPLVATIYLFVKVFELTDSALPEFINSVAPQFPDTWRPGLGLLVILVSAWFVGVLTKLYIGRMIIIIGNKLIVKIPIINKVYVAIQQILDAVFSKKDKIFEKVVLVEYPRKECHTVGFLSSSRPSGFTRPLGEDMVTVFVPTSPTPTQGFILIVKKEDIIELDMSVESALKFIMSAGIANPERMKQNQHLYDLPPSLKRWNWFENLKKRKQQTMPDPRD